jgi:hypothetical protein
MGLEETNKIEGKDESVKSKVSKREDAAAAVVTSSDDATSAVFNLSIYAVHVFAMA